MNRLAILCLVTLLVLMGLGIWIGWQSYKGTDLLPFYAILRSIPNKLLGVLAMFGSLLILLVMPVLDTSRIRGNQFRPFMRFAFWLFVVDFFVLMFIGSQHVTSPYIEIGAAATVFYFAWFLIVVPAVGVIENTLMDLAHQEDSR